MATKRVGTFGTNGTAYPPAAGPLAGPVARPLARPTLGRLAGAVGAVLMLAALAPAQPIITVMQESAPGAGDFSANVLGTIRGWRTDLSVDAFYNHTGCRYQGTAITPVEGRSHTFFADTPQGLTIYQVHDAAGLAGGHAEMRVAIWPRMPDEGWRRFTSSGWFWQYCRNSGWRRDEWDLDWSGSCNSGHARFPLVGSWRLETQFTQNVTGCDSRLLSPETPPIVGLFDWQINSSNGNAIAVTLAEDRRVQFVACNTPSIFGGVVACVGEATELLVVPGGTAPFTYQWLKNGSVLPGQTARSIALPSIAPSDAGTYECIVTNACGAATTRTQTITLLARCCPADFDDGSGTGTRDDAVTLDDLLFYIDLYEGGLIRADVDDGSGTGTRDQAVGIEDLLYYLARYDAGC